MVFKLTVLEALQKHSIQAVATLIEQQGCYGFDKYLRISNAELIKTNALSAIENYCSHATGFFDHLDREQKLGLKQDYSKLDWVDKCTDELKKFGWLDGFLPEFNDVKPSGIVIRNEDVDHPRRINTLLIIIAALLNYSDIKPEGTHTVLQLEELTKDIDVPVSEDTIREVLSVIPGLLERRRKSRKKP